MILLQAPSDPVPQQFIRGADVLNSGWKVPEARINCQCDSYNLLGSRMLPPSQTFVKSFTQADFRQF